MEIKIEDYLTDEEVKDIIAAEIRQQTRYEFHEKKLDPNTILSNAGYYAVFNAVDEYLGENGYAQKQVERETRRVLNKISEHTIFSDRGNYPKYRPSVAQQIVDESVDNYRDLIDKQVAERLEDIGDRIDGTKINEFITEVVRNALDNAVES